MNKKRFVSAVVVFLFFITLSFARQGFMWGEGKLRVSQTEFFDIIYSENSTTTASILYENADDIFRELAASYGVNPDGRLPVVITSGVQKFNAYYTYFPYNHIVIYDTAEFTDLAVFSQTLLSVFTHELTHALTYNLKSPLFSFLGNLFGDAFAGHYLTVTSGMAEGATLSYESSKGEGRLNDPYALQMVRQAKIENKFPSYSDVKGASDAYPEGAFYYFNGSFADYLQRTYGMEKYAQFWFRCVNMKNLSAGGAFKKTYGIKIKKAWKQFYDSIQIPELVSADPVKDGYANDFFKASAADFSIKNNAGSLYSNLRLCNDGFIYLDGSCNAVYLVSNTQNAKPKKLFTHDNIDYVNVSLDGRYITVGYYTGSAENVKHCAAVYDCTKKRWITAGGNNIVNPVVICSKGEYFFVYQNYADQKYSLCVRNIDQIKTTQNKAHFVFEQGAIPTAFTGTQDGQIAFILKQGLEYSICTCNPDFSDYSQYKFPLEGARIHALSFCNDESGRELLTFSWAVKETLPRFGMLDFVTGTFYLSDENVSGGVYSPVIMQGQVIYSGHFFKQNRLMTRDLEQFSLEQYESAAAEPQEVQSIAVPKIIQISQNLPYKPFKATDYAFEGLILPLPLIYSKTFIDFGSKAISDVGVGLSYLTSLPWDSGLFLLSGGYSVYTKSGIFGFEYTGGTGSSLFTYDLQSLLEIDSIGFKQTCNQINVSSSLDFGNRSMIGFSVQAEADYGRISYVDANSNIINNREDVFLKSLQAAGIVYSNIIKSGPGTYEKSGIKVGTTVVHDYEAAVKPVTQKIYNVYDLAFSMEMYIPKLIPIICFDNFTYNLPLKLSLGLFDFTNTSYASFQTDAKVILFGYDIQKAMPGISALFINAFTVSLEYNGALSFPDIDGSYHNWRFMLGSLYLDLYNAGRYKYTDYASVKLTLGMTPNIGTFANTAARFNLYCACSFGRPEILKTPVFSLGLDGKF